MKRNSRNKWISFLISLCGIMALPQILLQEGRGLGFSNSFLPVLLLALACPVIHRGLWKDGVFQKRPLLPLVLAFCFSLACGVGSRLEEKGYLELGDGKMWAALPFATLFFTVLIGEGWICLTRAAHEQDGGTGVLRKRWENLAVSKRRAALCLFFLASWGVLLLACWPGFFVYDAQEEFNQVALRSFSTHHPLPHVLLLGGIICAGNKIFGSYNAGIACYMCFQMLILAVCFTYVCDFMRKKKAPFWLRFGSAVYFALFPAISFYAVCSAKDALYSAGMLVAILVLTETMEDGNGFRPSRGKLLLLAGSLFVMASMRHNGFYILLLLIPALAFLAGKGKREGRAASCLRAAFAGIGAAVCCVALSACLQTVLQAQDEENQEMLTVPIQQLARTYAYNPEAFTQNERETLMDFLPIEALSAYRPKLSDLVKIQFNNETYGQDPGSFWRLWMSVGVKAPGSYLNAWLLTSYGLWYPEAVIDVYRGNEVFTFTYEDSSWFGFETELPGVRKSRIPWLNELVRRISLELFQQRIPVAAMLFSPGFLFWVYALGLGFLIWKGEARKAAAFLPAVLNWMTVIVGPTFLVRYVLIWWFALPVLLYAAGPKEE